MQLVRLLPPKHVGHVLDHIDTTFQGVQGGDMRIVERVFENAASDAPINRVARDGLGLPLDTIADPEERALKKRCMQVDIERMKADVERMENENKQAALELARKTKDTFQDLFGGMDDRDEIMLKDTLMNSLYSTGAVGMITNGACVREEITIDEIVKAVGMRPSHSISIQVGRLIAKAYRERHNKEPPTCKRYVQGAQRDVKTYLKADEPWMLDVAREYREKSYKA
eukprot:3939114-Rhodomonas_salina.1